MAPDARSGSRGFLRWDFGDGLPEQQGVAGQRTKDKQALLKAVWSDLEATEPLAEAMRRHIEVLLRQTYSPRSHRFRSVSQALTSRTDVGLVSSAFRRSPLSRICTALDTAYKKNDEVKDDLTNPPAKLLLGYQLNTISDARKRGS